MEGFRKKVAFVSHPNVFTFLPDPRCWKRSKSDSSYITPGGITFHFDTHKLVRRLQENG